jgi:geranylgeranyl diphosphate synthase type II
MMAVYTALAAENEQNTPKLAKLAIAIESFHKASLAHDDIVDNDTSRYGEASLLKEHSMKITLNTGDLLLSYGYQLIADSGLNTKQIQKLITAASKAHRDLCLGQGEELLWQQKMQMPSVEKTIEIFALKTAPAFEVSLVFGAIAAEKEALLSSVLKNYSHAIGIAYQIRDDIDDFNPEQINNDISDFRPSLILAILNENNPELMQNKLHQHINKGNAFANDIFTWAEKSGAIEIAKQMLDVYKSKALESLEALENTSVKILLYQLLNKIIG